MNPEDIKIGARISLSGYISNKTDKHIFITINTGFNEYTKIKFTIPKALELYPINPYTPLMLQTTTVIPETYPKYDPCRNFREGDIVTPCDVKGRWLSDYWKNKAGQHFVVTKDESGGEIPILDIKAKPFEVADYLPAVYFELVTPVEELEPYFVMELKGGYGVYNTRFQPETEACHYWNEMHPHAKEAAEAECDRLNAEYRKEQE